MICDAGVREGTILMGKHGSCFDDEFMLYEFKIAKCLLTQQHLWRDCPFVHPGEPVHRRHPSLYKGDLCPAVKQGQICPHGPAKCSYAHNAFEAWLHPERYKTIMCRKGARCTRDICFFAHSPAEVRAPTSPQSAPPADRATEALAATSKWITGGTSQVPVLAPLPLQVSPAVSPGLPADQAAASGTLSAIRVGPAASKVAPAVTMSGPSLAASMPGQQLPAVSLLTLQAPATSGQQQGVASTQCNAASAVFAGTAPMSNGTGLELPHSLQWKHTNQNHPWMVTTAASFENSSHDLNGSSDRALRTAVLRLQLQAALQGLPLPEAAHIKSAGQAIGCPAAAAVATADSTHCLNSSTYGQLLAQEQLQQQQTSPQASSICQQGVLLPSPVAATGIARSNSSCSKTSTTNHVNVLTAATAVGLQHQPAAFSMLSNFAVTAPVSAVSDVTQQYVNPSAVALTALPVAACNSEMPLSGAPMKLLQVVGKQQQVAAYANTTFDGSYTIGIGCKQVPSGGSY